MTVLKVATADQTLIAMERVKIGSGDIESVFLNVEFDDVWESFINKSASFFTSHDSTHHEVLLIDDQCIIPAEVLAKPGTLYIGIVGVAADGQAVKTSCIIGFKISQGAMHGYATITPELNMYQQYLKATKEAVSPVLLDFKSKAEVLKNDLWDAIEAHLLWTNPTPEAEFGSQSVPLDLSEYKRFIVVCRESVNDDSVYDATITEKGTKYAIQRCKSSTYELSRQVWAYDDNMLFEDCKASSGTVDNTYITPVKVYGFKY